MSEEEKEEIMSLTSTQKIIIAFVIGILIGSFAVGFYKFKSDYRTPEEIATYLEEMLLQNKHYEDIVHSQLKGMISTDTTTIGDFKRWYLIYNRSGVPRDVLLLEINKICFKNQFKLR